jgi:hypothetical protein
MKLCTNAKLLMRAKCGAVLASQDPLGKSARWPMPVLKSTNDASIFSEPFVAKSLYKAFKILERKGYSTKDFGKFMYWPSTYARLAFIFRSRTVWQLTRTQQIELINYLADSLATRYQFDPFCLKGKNILLDQQSLTALKNQLRKRPNINPKLVSQLDARLWLYTEMLYSRWHNLGHEFHGPYCINKEELLIKEWHDLNRFRSFMGRLPISRITCYESFTNNTVKLDLYNRLWTKKPLMQTIKQCWVEVDGKYISNQRLKKLITQIDNRLHKGVNYLERLTATQLKIMNAEMEFYAAKELLKEAGLALSPPSKLISKIKNNIFSPIEKHVLVVLSKFYKKVTPFNLKIQFDPSVEFIYGN